MVQQLAAFMDDMPALPLVVLYAVLVGPLVALIHEMGHACVALWRTTGPVVVVVAVPGLGVGRRVGRVQFAAQPVRGADGLCAYDQQGLAGWEIALVALAGPFASLVAAAATFALTPHVSGVLQGLLWAMTFGGALGGIVGALPLTFRTGKGDDAVDTRLDGLQARDALRGRPRPSQPGPPAIDVKAGPVAERWAAEVDAATERARTQRASANVARLRARDDERRARSVAPPGF
jgi:hypothetical protein